MHILVHVGRAGMYANEPTSGGKDAHMDQSSWDQLLLQWMKESPVPGVPRTSAVVSGSSAAKQHTAVHCLQSPVMAHTVYCKSAAAFPGPSPICDRPSFLISQDR